MGQTKKDEILRDLGRDIANNEHIWQRTQFGLWIEGSYEYDGEAKYKATKKFIETNWNNHKKMRTFVIRNFTEVIAEEFSISYGYAQKCIVELYGNKENLATYTNQLIVDAIDQFKN